MISQRPSLLFSCDASLESERSPDTVMDWEALFFWEGQTVTAPHRSCPHPAGTFVNTGF